MADVEWPSDLVPYQMTFYLQHHSAVFESPFTRQQQVLRRSAPRWVGKMSLRGGAGGVTLKHGVGSRVEALLAEIAGPQKTFTLFDFRRPTGRGELQAFDDYAATVPLTTFDDATNFDDGTGFYVGQRGPVATIATGRRVVFSAVWPGTSPREVGDYIGLGDGRPHMVTSVTPADGSGRSALTFEPALPSGVSSAAHEFAEVRGTFRLTTDDTGSNPTDVAGLASYEIDFIEVL